MTNPTLQQRIARLEQELVKDQDIAPLPTFVYFTYGQDNEQKKRLDINKAFADYKARHADNKTVQGFNSVDDLYKYVHDTPTAEQAIISVVFRDTGKKRPRVSLSKPSYEPETVVDLSKAGEQTTIDNYLDRQAKDFGEYLDNLPSDIEKTLNKWGRA